MYWFPYNDDEDDFDDNDNDYEDGDDEDDDDYLPRSNPIKKQLFHVKQFQLVSRFVSKDHHKIGSQPSD